MNDFAFGALHHFAVNCLEEDGEIGLGALLYAIRERNEVFTALDPRAAVISELTLDEAHALYERVLERLEQEFGPLRTSDPLGSDAVMWGYAGLFDPNAARPICGDMLSVERRSNALRNGHPDATQLEGLPFPETVWYAEHAGD